MNERDLRIFLLRALQNCGDRPMPESALKSSIELAAGRMTGFDLDQIIRGVESKGWIAGTDDELLGKLWMLTPKGKLQLAKL